MNKKLLLNIILIRMMYLVAAILTAGIVAGIIAAVASVLTNNVNIIVMSCLVGVWLAEIILYLLRCKITFKKRIKALETKSLELINKEKKRLTKWYIASTTFFALILGYIFLGLNHKLINEVTGINPTEKTSSTFDNKVILLSKVALVVLLVIILIIRTIRKKKEYKN